IVVGACGEAVEPVVKARSRGENEDRDTEFCLADGTAEIEPVAVGQQQIENDGVKAARSRELLNLPPDALPVHGETASSEAVADETTDADIVFDQEDVH